MTHDPLRTAAGRLRLRGTAALVGIARGVHAVLLRLQANGVAAHAGQQRLQNVPLPFWCGRQVRRPH
jgi:hypothetical protein